MESDKIYEKETGQSAWTMYAHLAGPTSEFLTWLDKAALKMAAAEFRTNTNNLYADAQTAHTKVSSIMASDYFDSVRNTREALWRDGFESGFYAARQQA
jgi:hypothetical protein